MGRALSDTRIAQLETLVKQELKPLETVAEAIESRARFSIEVQLKSELGLRAVLEKKEQLESELKDVNDQLRNFIGDPDYHDRKSGFHDYSRDSIFGKEVAARMAQLNGVIGEWRIMKRKALRAVHLAEAPQAVANMMDKLQTEIPKMLVAFNTKMKELPQLPEPAEA